MKNVKVLLHSEHILTVLPDYVLSLSKLLLLKSLKKITFGSKIYMQPLDPYYHKKVNISQFLVLNQRKNV